MNIEHPKTVQNMASIYFDSGSDIVLTNSFGGNKFRLKHYGLDNKVEQFNELASSLA